MTINKNGAYSFTTIGNTSTHFKNGLTVGYAQYYFLRDGKGIFADSRLTISSHEHNHPQYEDGSVADYPSGYDRKSRLVKQGNVKGDVAFANDLKKNKWGMIERNIEFYIRPQGKDYRVKYDGINPYTHVK